MGSTVDEMAEFLDEKYLLKLSQIDPELEEVRYAESRTRIYILI